MLQGISHTPRINLKIKPQGKDPIYGNGSINQYIGWGADLCHCKFKDSFLLQDPLITPPPRKECPNFKAEPFSTGFLIQYISFKTYILGKNIAGDKQKVAFKGIHDDKLHINFKKAQYGFQSDASCNGRYTLCFYFRNQPPPEKYVIKGFYLLHSCIFSLFDCHESKVHRLDMDNLYKSVRYAKACFTYEKKYSGMAWKGRVQAVYHMLWIRRN